MNKIASGNLKKRRLKDAVLNAITYLSSGISVLVLAAIFIFVFTQGFSSLSFDLLTGNYWANNYLTAVEADRNAPDHFQAPKDLGKDVAFSKAWGVGFVDALDENKEPIVLIEYIDEASPFASLIDKSVHDQEAKLSAEVGYQVERINYMGKDGHVKIVGNLMSNDAKQVAQTLDQNAQSIQEMYFKTPGGGIRGSILATLYLIVVALLVSLPLGIAAAIYLREYASKNKLTDWIRSAVEMLSGVPSIIFGLMGVTVLFPITQLFGATTTNILLGGLTLAVILLPTIIRSCEEALIVVPQSLRDASLSLGASKSQTIFKVVLPNAIPGILTGVLLSIGRVIGESAALIYTMGTYVNDAPQLLSQGTSLAVHIYNIMSSEQPNFELACAISIVILVFVLILNISIKWISRRFHKAMQ